MPKNPPKIPRCQKKHCLCTSFFEKLTRTCACWPVTQAMNPMEIVQKPVQMAFFLSWVDCFGWISPLSSGAPVLDIQSHRSSLSPYAFKVSQGLGLYPLIQSKNHQKGEPYEVQGGGCIAAQAALSRQSRYRGQSQL